MRSIGAVLFSRGLILLPLVASVACGASSETEEPCEGVDPSVDLDVEIGETAQPLVSGDRPLLVVLLQGADGSTVAHDEDWYRNRIFGYSGERNVRDYFLATSFGRFTYHEADTITVQDDLSLNSVAGVTSKDSNTGAQRKRVRYLAGRAGFPFRDFAHGNGEVSNDELTILEIDPYSGGAGQWGQPSCTTVSGTKVCSGVALTGHRASLELVIHELAHGVHPDVTDLYGPDSNSRHLAIMGSSSGSESDTATAFMDPYHRGRLGWTRNEATVAAYSTLGNWYKVGYLGNTAGDLESLRVTTPVDSTGAQESVTFEARARLDPYDNEPNVGLYAWYSELKSDGRVFDWPSGDKSHFILAPLEGCRLHAGDVRSIGPSVPLNAGGYAWYWALGVLTFGVQPTDGGYYISWGRNELPRSCEGIGATLWQHENFAGPSQTFGRGVWDSQAFNIFGNDQATSLIVSPGYTARVCNGEGGTGCQTFRGATNYWSGNLGSLSDNVSYIDVQPDRFRFSYAGPIAGYQCKSVNEASDPDTWGDNYFCSAVNEGMEWSSSGPIPGRACIQIREPSDPHTWEDNYLCFGNEAYLNNMQWSYEGPVPGKICVQWTEPADPHTWDDNYLCY